MPTFLPSTADIPVPEVLGGKLPENLESEYWASDVVAYLKKIEKHVETVSRGLNATSQFAWGESSGVVELQGAKTIQGGGPVMILSTDLVMPVDATAIVHYKVGFDYLTNSSANTFMRFYATVDGKKQSHSESFVFLNSGASWLDNKFSSAGFLRFEMKKLKSYKVAIVGGWDDDTTGVVSTLPSVTSLIYRLVPRVAE